MSKLVLFAISAALFGFSLADQFRFHIYIPLYPVLSFAALLTILEVRFGK